MVLNKYRSSADRILMPFAKAFSGLSPNTLSLASVIFALIAGIALIFADRTRIEDVFYPGRYIYVMFIIASACIFLNGFLDAVDGKVARLTNKTSKRGDFLDHALDRYADILILSGIMLCPFCDTTIGALAIIGVLMTSYMGTQAQALGCGRNYSGLLGRADRMVILIIAPLLQMWVVYYFPNGRLPVIYIENFTILEYIMLWFFIAGNITAVHRGIRSWSELREQEEQVNNHKKRAKEFYESLSKVDHETEKINQTQDKSHEKKQSNLMRQKNKDTKDLKLAKATRATKVSKNKKPLQRRRVARPRKLKTQNPTKPANKSQKTRTLRNVKNGNKNKDKKFEIDWE